MKFSLSRRWPVKLMPTRSTNGRIARTDKLSTAPFLSAVFAGPTAPPTISSVCCSTSPNAKRPSSANSRRAPNTHSGIIASQEAEREAHQLASSHDSLGQCLSLIKNHVQLILLQKRIPAAVRKELETISETTSDAIAEMRRISQDLHPYQLDHLGLTGALTALIEGAANASHIAFEKQNSTAAKAFFRAMPPPTFTASPRRR